MNTRRLPAPVWSLLLCLLCSAAAQAAPAYRPKPFTANYIATAYGIKVGEIKRSLRIEPNGTYVLENDMHTTGLAALFKPDRALERSTWVYKNDKPEPIAYYAHYTGRSKDLTERLDFDWKHNVVHSLRDGKVTDVPLVPGTLDKLMYQIALRGDIAAGKKHIEYQVADRGKIKPYIFDVIGSEDVITDRGKVHAIKVRKGTTTFWVAPKWDYLLVKLVQVNDDSKFATYITAN